MPEKLSLDEKLLKINASHYKRQLGKTNINFYNIVKELDGSANGLPSVEVSAAANAMERFFSTYKTFKDALRSNGIFHFDTPEKVDFLETYSLYAGAAEASFQLSKLSQESTDLFKSGSVTTIDFGKDEYTTYENLITNYISVVKKKARNHQELVSVSKDFFEWVMDEALKESKKDKYSDMVAISNRLHVKVNDITICGFNIRDKLDEKNYHYSHSLKDIVGNRNMISVLTRAVDKLIMYDSQEKVNVNLTESDGFSQTFTFWGRPGCGKSATIEAVLAYATEEAEKSNKTLIVKKITNEFKSEYYGKSSNNLKQLLDQPGKGDACYILVADDIDTVFFSRENLKDSPQDKANLQPLLDFLEGIGSGNNGNYLFISTTNRPLEIDSAAVSRLKEEEMMIKGPEARQDYVDLFNIKLRKSIEKGYVDVKRWDAIGELCVKYDFSGRAVKDIAKRVVSLISDVDMPAGIAGKKPSEQVIMLHKLYEGRKVGDDQIIKIIHSYHENEQLQIQQAQQASLERKVEYKREEALADEIVKSIKYKR